MLFAPDAWVCIVAGGPSLRGFDFSRLAGRPHIAINRAFEVCPQATALYWTDGKFWLNPHRGPDGRVSYSADRAAAIQRHAAPLKATMEDHVYRVIYPPGIRVYRKGHAHGLSDDPDTLNHGNNSGFAAINMAVHEGARRLILLGYDMRLGPDGADHFHDGYVERVKESTLSASMLPFYRTLVGPLAALGVQVRNASPDSAIPHWPRMTPEECGL